MQNCSAWLPPSGKTNQPGLRLTVGCCHQCTHTCTHTHTHTHTTAIPYCRLDTATFKECVACNIFVRIIQIGQCLLKVWLKMLGIFFETHCSLCTSYIATTTFANHSCMPAFLPATCSQLPIYSVKCFFMVYKSTVELLPFIFSLRFHLSHNKDCVGSSFSWSDPNCIHRLPSS